MLPAETAWPETGEVGGPRDPGASPCDGDGRMLGVGDEVCVVKSSSTAHHELASTTARISPPYLATFADPIPGTDSSSASLPGRRSAIAARVASVATT